MTFVKAPMIQRTPIDMGNERDNEIWGKIFDNSDNTPINPSSAYDLSFRPKLLPFMVDEMGYEEIDDDTAYACKYRLDAGHASQKIASFIEGSMSVATGIDSMYIDLMYDDEWSPYDVQALHDDCYHVLHSLFIDADLPGCDGSDCDIYTLMLGYKDPFSPLAQIKAHQALVNAAIEAGVSGEQIVYHAQDLDGFEETWAAGVPVEDIFV